MLRRGAALVLGQRLDGLAGPVDLAGEGIASGGIPGSLGAARRGQVLLLDVYFDGIAEGLDLGEPRARLTAVRSRWAGGSPRVGGPGWMVMMAPQSAT